MLFELQMSLCGHFPNLSPFEIREKRFVDVFLLVRRLNNYNTKKDNKPKKIKKPAGDNWF